MAKKNRRIPMFTWGFFYGKLASKNSTQKLRVFTFPSHGGGGCGFELI
jgi:hypothetical protein